MRRAQNPELIFNDEVLLGVNLSYDFCAEHEWGIKGLKNAFGISEDISDYGMKRRKITIVPKTVEWIKYTKEGLTYEGFIFNPHYYNGGAVEYAITSTELNIYKPFKGEMTKYLTAAWDENSFAVLSIDPDTVKHLREIFEQFQRKNIVIMLSGASNPFANSGLVIGIADRLPKDIVDMWETCDKEAHEIKKEFEATGIEALLSKSGKRYYALSPRRQKDGSLMYWLNPYEQQKNNSGWFTLEDLKLWAVEEGPIPKSKASAKIQ